ncbi:threonine synthase [Salinimicrobium terrae]|uniref:threonine synthase n=1 Tax=Salinimicrobium terrae TaxID=470866 RepID=UPI00041F2E24|nr:threonine synthase [Salinimicrobium terrae]
MKYFSLNDRSHTSNFENAVLNGLGPDRGLYFPQEVKKLPKQFFEQISSLLKTEIAMEAISPYVGDEIPPSELEKIIKQTLDFEFPVKKIEENLAVLELFHGPTLAFKDVGARFMAGTLGYFIKKGNIPKVTVLVATSGDTGGAVARGFLGVEGIDVVILYPKGKVSEIQEKQLTTLGQNIKALEVDGSFDDCQTMVKTAFLDPEITRQRKLTSANSINVARWLPQMFYYFLAYQQVKKEDQKLVFSVPSGNFGNICAGLLAKEMGLPIHHFVAANNENDVVTRFLKTQKYEPATSVQTISNAMDVGDPSNFIRVLEIFSNNFSDLQKSLSSYSFSDGHTREAIKDVHDKTGYILDPHGAVGYLGLKKFLEKHDDYFGVFLETAHPVKFLETVEAVLNKKIQLPPEIENLNQKEKRSIEISNYDQLKSFLRD